VDQLTLAFHDEDADQDVASSLHEIVDTTFDDVFASEMKTRMHAKLGLTLVDTDTLTMTNELIRGWWHVLAATGADFTTAFRVLADIQIQNENVEVASIERVLQALLRVSQPFEHAKWVTTPQVTPAQFEHLQQLVATNASRAAQYGISAEVSIRIHDHRWK
jgi:uncharacterized protein YdiU (UPF0061 family)